jgi:hypothetical protein
MPKAYLKNIKHESIRPKEVAKILLYAVQPLLDEPGARHYPQRTFSAASKSRCEKET